MNQYPAWKYLLILLVLSVGVLYALPNLFGEDPALQVTSARGFAIPANLETSIEDALVAENLEFKNMERAGNKVLYRFNSTEDQLRASEVIKKALGEQYVVALNLAHATPTWLRAIGGKPMTLGLDLQGGVHFLMQVDMNTARSQQLDRYVDDLRAAMRDERIRYVSVRREGNGLLALLRSVEDRDKALDLIRRDQSLQGLIVEELDYEPVMWSFVFPLGMYSVASARLGLAAEFPPLQWISELMIWVAFAVWLGTLAGLVRRLGALLIGGRVRTVT